jgi:hypothetical protein
MPAGPLGEGCCDAWCCVDPHSCASARALCSSGGFAVVKACGSIAMPRHEPVCGAVRPWQQCWRFPHPLQGLSCALHCYLQLAPGGCQVSSHALLQAGLLQVAGCSWQLPIWRQDKCAALWRPGLSAAVSWSALCYPSSLELDCIPMKVAKQHWGKELRHHHRHHTCM